MFSLIEAKNFRCLRYVSRPLDRFHVLVGPNASGKSTFLDVVTFLGTLVSDGLEAAVGLWTDNFVDLVWGRRDEPFELAIEATIPANRLVNTSQKRFTTVRYEICVGSEEGTKQVALLAERVLLKEAEAVCAASCQRALFPTPPTPPDSILSPVRTTGTRTIVNKVRGGNDNFYSEAYDQPGKGWAVNFKLGAQKSALGNLPEDESKFPVSTWLKSLLAEGIQKIVLNSLLMRKASPPGQTRRFKADGSNLPWVVEGLRTDSPSRFREWISHLATALTDLQDVRTIEREDDRHRYLMLKYHGGLEVPSWVASDGTLRLMALTLPAYLEGVRGVFLIEEPENGIHPRAVETLYQSLSSVYDAQVLVATHSPTILSLVEPKSVLCFAKTQEGATDVVTGEEHPRLRDWRREENLSVLFAAGVLG
jgi:predicted ATPase